MRERNIWKMRKTKIVCTLGPSTDDENVLRQLMLEGISVLYGEHRETATERCYALFWQIQQLKSVQGQLERCFALLWVLNMATAKSSTGLFASPFAPMCI